MTPREMARRRRVRAVQARLLMASRPEDVARVAQLLGGHSMLAAYTLLDDNGDVDACCKRLDAALSKLAADMMRDAKQHRPVDTSELRHSLNASVHHQNLKARKRP